MHITVFWKIHVDLRVFLCCFKYFLNTEVLILRAVEHFDVIAFDANSLIIEWEFAYNFLFPETKSFRK